jgi:hypothetical protein
MILRVLLLATFLAACGGSSASTPPPAKPDPVKPEAAAVTTCDDACTQIATCWEEVNGGDYSGGGECTSDCEGKSDAERQTYFTCIGAHAECKDMLDC